MKPFIIVLSVILAENHMNIVDTLSTLEEIIRYLNSMGFDHKKAILSQHFLAIVPKIVGMKDSSDIVIHASEYYATSRSLYNQLRQDFQLPSIETLRRMSKVSKLNEKSFFAICI